MNSGRPENEAGTLSLLKRARAGEAEAAEELFKGNLALVRSVAKRYAGRAEFEDLVQIGSLGLLKAVRGFDAELGNKLSTYAVPLIAGEIKRFLRDDGIIRVSRRLKEDYARLSALSRSIEEERGAPPGLEELARALGMEPTEAAAALEAALPCRSVDEKLFGDENETTLGETIPAGGGFEDSVLDRVLVGELLRALPPDERELLILRFFSRRTQAETAAALGLTQVKVSRLEKKVLAKMRKEIGY